VQGRMALWLIVVVMPFVSASATLFSRTHGFNSRGMPGISLNSRFIANHIIIYGFSFSVTVFCDNVSLLIFHFLIGNDYITLVSLLLLLILLLAPHHLSITLC